MVSILVGFIGHASFALSRAWEIDEKPTNFYLSVDHIYSKVQGRSTDYEGTILFDPDNLGESEIAFKIKVKSVETGINKRDRHLRSEDFFEASRYPLITFASSETSKTGENTYAVNTTLTIKVPRKK